MPIDRDYPRFPEHPRAPYSFPGRGGAGLERRRTVRLRVPNANEAGPIPALLKLAGPGAFLLRMVTTIPMWLRVYGSAADRLRDTNRTVDGGATAPIIADILFSLAVAPTELSRSGWVAGPGCTRSDLFHNAVDIDADPAAPIPWTNNTNQASGHTFSVDFGSPLYLGSVLLSSNNAPSDFPRKISVEVSDDGVAWTMLVPGVLCWAMTTVLFYSPITTRYMRFVITQVAADPTKMWTIFEFRAYAPSPSFMDIRLFDQDVEGIPAFNWDDPALPQLYVLGQATDPLMAGALYGRATFDSPILCISPWFLPPIGGNPLIYGLPECTYANAQILNLELPWADVPYIEPGGLKYRYYMNWAEMRCLGTTRNIARLGDEVEDGVSLANIRVIRSGITDTTQFSVEFCTFLSGAVGWDNLPHLRAGISRSDAAHVLLTITWLDGNGANQSLGTSAPIALGSGGALDFSVQVTRASTGVVTCTVTAGATVLSATVPSDLTSLANHKHVGVLMTSADPPSAPLSWGGAAIKTLYIYSADRALVVDVGYVTVEASGGTLRFIP
jgi:hypothetical protein